ncbi:hypothetical protein PG995_015765 [Apiospora arundinis]
MAAFPLFKSLPPELRCNVWEEARTVIVHRVTMRVMPHPSTRSMIMNVNQESRHYAMNIFFDVHLDVRMLSVDFDLATEIAAFTRTPRGYDTDGHDPRAVYGGFHGGYLQWRFTSAFWCQYLRPMLHNRVKQQLKASPRRLLAEGTATRRKGLVYVSSQHDKFALTKAIRTQNAPWGSFEADQCERAFLRDHVCRTMNRALGNCRNCPASPYGNSDGEFLSRHMADRLPQSVQLKVRRVIYMHDEWSLCRGSYHSLFARDFKLGTFKGAREYYSAYMPIVPAATSLLGAQRLVEWQILRTLSNQIIMEPKPKRPKVKRSERSKKKPAQGD